MLEPQHGWQTSQLVHVARRAEEFGFGYLFRSDHLMPIPPREE